jgi:hypothetical protein
VVEGISRIAAFFYIMHVSIAVLSGSWGVAGWPHHYEQLVNQCDYFCAGRILITSLVMPSGPGACALLSVLQQA